MRYLILGAVLILAMAAPVQADVGLTDAVAAAYFARTVDEGLHAIAHQRVVQISACGCLEHDGMRPETAEVLVWNRGQTNPVASALGAWRASPTHNAILSDRQFGFIGCAERIVAGVHSFACVLAAGPLSPPSVVVLPDTAVPPVLVPPSG
jgi:hypothetical protein